MRLFGPTEVAPGVYQIPALGAKVAVLFDAEGIVLVDTGWRRSLGLVEAGLKALGSTLAAVRLVVLSHSHPDHMGELANVVAATGAKVAVHWKEVETVANRAEALPSPFHNPLLARLTAPLLPLFYGPPVPVAYSLQDGDRLPTAREVRVIHTPGHTPGNICLFMPSERLLFAGDALQYRFHRLSPPAFWVTHNYPQATDSLKRLLNLDFTLICFSHFPPLRHDARGALGRLVKKIEEHQPHRR
ncbi:MAG: MBL fold metallo-hydrolase [Chloroflexi bacterium]|nr:MBL fold metallo-hydrolase [Chloroflexota bacterium]